MGARMNRINLAFALFLFGCTELARGEITGNELYSQLRSSNQAEYLSGMAYIEGVLDTEDFYLTADIFSSTDPKTYKTARFKIPHLCFGGNKVALGQLKDIVQKFLEANPGKRHIRAASLIRFALLEDFACANNPVTSATK